MPIDELTNEDVNQRCAACGATRRVDLSTLFAGDEGPDPESIATDVMRLPPCASCGAVEFLARSPINEPPHPSPGSFGHLHRLLVDELHAELVKRDRVPTALRAKERKHRSGLVRLHSAELKTWFPERLKIELRETEQNDTAKEPGQ